MIKDSDIQKIQELDIVDVVSDYVNLKKAGVNYKGLCPFHKDKTPSFSVSPSKNICLCFSCGEGGGPISFIQKIEGLSFPEACKFLAKKYNIKIEEEEDREKTKEEIELAHKKESAFAIYEYVQKHFIDNLHSDTPEAKAALSYAKSRWGMTEVVERGLGYSTPQWDDIITFAKKKGLSIPIMKELGLIRVSEKGNEYGFFNDRLMIPIRDKFGRIIGYTARTMDEHKEKGQKYINSIDSFLFHKGSTLFGLDIAHKKGARSELFYIVEGGPDVIKMQQIGAENTIAALGTAFTKEQFDMLKRYRASLCFIPDADEAGIAAVMKNGKMAMEEGFRVLVKEIPTTDDGKKQDADSYFNNITKVEAVSNEDFVMWYARHVYDEEKTDTAKSDAVRDICDILVTERDEYTRASFVESLSAKYGHKNLWKNAINEAKKRRSDEKARRTTKKSGIDLQKYGFYETHNCYFSQKDGNELQWSNFKMKPLYHIMGVDDSKRLYEITNVDGQTRTLELNAEELVSIQKFMIKVESNGNFLWYASIQELMTLKKYLYDITGTAIKIRQYGWQRKGFWAFGNGCIYNNKFIPADHMGIVHLHDEDKEMDNYYLQGASDIYADDTSYFGFERQFIKPDTHASISLRDFSTIMVEVFGNNAKIAICYLLASLFRDVITSYTTNFPLLNLFGPKGSGKTELGITLMRFFTIGDRPLNLRNTTAPGLSQALAMSANGLCHLDEYKNTLDMKIIEIIKGAYDGVGRARMDMDRGKQIEKTPVDCGVIVSGQEMPTLDIAMFSRMIFLTHDSTTHDRAAKDKFNHLVDIRKMGLQHLTQEILSHRQLFVSSFYENYNDVTNEVYDHIDGAQIEDRLWRNWVILLTAYKTLYRTLELPFEYEEMKELVIAGIKRQNSEVLSNNELGNLWNAMTYLNEEGMIHADADFKIRYLRKLKTDQVAKEYNTDTPILMIRLNHFIGQYKRMAKQQGESVMSKDSIRYYLTTSTAYLGQKNCERWKQYEDGKPKVEYRQVDNERTKAVEISKFDRCMCFDYRMLKDKFDLNLETVSGEQADSMEKDYLDQEAKEVNESINPTFF